MLTSSGLTASLWVCLLLSLQIYKSTKCNDMQQSGSCPRGPFCAFAHIESKSQ